MIGEKGFVTPDYWEDGCQHIMNTDGILAPIILKHRSDVLKSHGDVFRTLVNAVVGQQISVAAAAAIWQRLTGVFPEMTPEQLEHADENVLKNLGLSRQKVRYIQDIGAFFNHRDFDLPLWVRGNDDEVLKRLTGLRGVGPWTGQMVLIFSLLRPDVLPLGDIGLLRCAARIYGWDESLPLKEIQKKLEIHSEIWKPYRTIGVWYVWRELDAEPVLY